MILDNSYSSGSLERRVRDKKKQRKAMFQNREAGYNKVAV